MEPGGWLIDPLNASPAVALEAARAGYRVVVTYSPSNTKYKSWLDEMKGKLFPYAEKAEQRYYRRFGKR